MREREGRDDTSRRILGGHHLCLVHGAMVELRLSGGRHVVLGSKLCRCSRVASVCRGVVFVVTFLEERVAGRFVSVARGNLRMMIAATSTNLRTGCVCVSCLSRVHGGWLNSRA